MNKLPIGLAAAVVALASMPVASAQDLGVDDFRPSIVSFDAPLTTSQEKLARLCSKLVTRQITPPFIVLRQSVKIRQMQVDCDGFSFGGAPRWAEFIFADDALVMVWILTEARDEAELLRQMTLAYGPPTHRNEKFIAFANHGAALRTDRPEILFFAPRLASGILPWFGTPTTFR